MPNKWHVTVQVCIGVRLSSHSSRWQSHLYSGRSSALYFGFRLGWFSFYMLIVLVLVMLLDVTGNRLPASYLIVCCPDIWFGYICANISGKLPHCIVYVHGNRFSSAHSYIQLFFLHSRSGL